MYKIKQNTTEFSNCKIFWHSDKTKQNLSIVIILFDFFFFFIVL